MKDRTKKVAIGTILAASVGYLAGILTAPKKGSDTRKDIVDAGLKTKSEAEKKFKQLNTELGGLIRSVESVAKRTTTTAKTELPKHIKNAKSAQAKVREILSSLHEGDPANDDLKHALDEGKKSIEHLKKFLKSSDSDKSSK